MTQPARDLRGPGETREPLLEVRDLSVHFPRGRRWFGRHGAPLKAVDEVSFSVAPREIVGLVGESGSGKSTLARAILRLTEPTAGSVRLCGTEILGLDPRALRDMRRRMQVIFQDPYASLNPRMTAGDNIAEGLRLLGAGTRAARAGTIAELLRQVGLPADAAGRYPHEFSGGQRQRIGIARALAVQPALIVADEPVSALDLSIQAQILNLLLDQQEQRGLALLFIGHDLSVIRHFCDRLLVLYRGRLVEIGTTEELFTNPQHPYTRALLDAAPATHPSRRAAADAPVAELGEPPEAGRGCAFSTRCAHVLAACHDAAPPLRGVTATHFTACLRTDLPTRHRGIPP
jgi:oligopeptide/dipeptide ABC transporter ATP-binding protein